VGWALSSGDQYIDDAADRNGEDDKQDPQPYSTAAILLVTIIKLNLLSPVIHQGTLAPSAYQGNRDSVIKE
jgi:hypothetical protein